MACFSYRSLRRMSTRFPVIAPKAAVVSDDMMASVAGLDILRRGGNAADAAVAMAACMHVLQPFSSGLGGDCFALYYNAQEKQVHSVDGSGSSPAALTLELVESRYLHQKQMYGLQATVPGAAKAWHDIITHFGSTKLSFSELFSPAVHYAEHGFPIDHMKYDQWRFREESLKLMPGGRFFLNNENEVPAMGQLVVNQPLAQLLKRIAAEGPRAIYEGSVAECMVEAVHCAGGVLSTKDLSDHLASSHPVLVKPVETTYRGDVTVHTTPLPTHGAVMLEALNILEGFDLAALQELPGQCKHVMVEALRHATADGMRYVGDPEAKAAITKMLSRERARECAASVKLDRKMEEVCPDIGRPQKHTGTTFLAAADEAGNVCAFTGSLARNFGCAVVEQHGFAVQARGNGFNKIAGHPNCVGPRKKPYHTLMPVIVTDARTKDWLCTLGAMGGAMQPNILLQVLLNMLELGLDPQQSVSKARVLLGSMFSVHPDTPLVVEAGFDQEMRRELQQRGHIVNIDNSKTPTYHAGHVNVLCRAPQWWMKERASAEDHKLPLWNGPIWCGVETRSSSVALGY